MLCHALRALVWVGEHLVLGLQMRELSLRVSQLLLCLFQARKRFWHAGGVWYAVGLCTGLYLIQLCPSLDALFCCYFRRLLPHIWDSDKHTLVSHICFTCDLILKCTWLRIALVRQGTADLGQIQMDSPPWKAQSIPRNHPDNQQ